MTILQELELIPWRQSHQAIEESCLPGGFVPDGAMLRLLIFSVRKVHLEDTFNRCYLQSQFSVK